MTVQWNGVDGANGEGWMTYMLIQRDGKKILNLEFGYFFQIFIFLNPYILSLKKINHYFEIINSSIKI